jgi:hypothetical protein
MKKKVYYVIYQKKGDFNKQARQFENLSAAYRFMQEVGGVISKKIDVEPQEKI